MKLFLFTASVFLAFLIGCKESTEPIIENRAGFCLTFDDAYVREWFKIMELLDSNNVKTTFFVTQINQILQDDIKLLQKIKESGHEIGSHGWQHISSTEFLEQHTIKEYCEEEIVPSIETMESYNLTPISYSYPYGHNCDSLDQVLLEMFSGLRDVTDEQRKPLEKRINNIEEIYYKFDKAKVISGLGIDKIFNISLEMLEEGIKRASEKNEVIVFYCHKPVENASSTYQVEYRYLRSLFDLTRKYNLINYTFSELVN